MGREALSGPGIFGRIKAVVRKELLMHLDDSQGRDRNHPINAIIFEKRAFCATVSQEVLNGTN
jgi:hypothetical protein